MLSNFSIHRSDKNCSKIPFKLCQIHIFPYLGSLCFRPFPRFSYIIFFHNLSRSSHNNTVIRKNSSDYRISTHNTMPPQNRASLYSCSIPDKTSLSNRRLPQNVSLIHNAFFNVRIFMIYICNKRICYYCCIICYP